MVLVMADPFKKRSVHIALVIDGDRSGLAVLLGSSAPDAVLVLGQARDMGIALGLDLLLRFAAGEAVGAGNRGGGIVLMDAFDRLVLRTFFGRVRRGVLGESKRRRQQQCRGSEHDTHDGNSLI